MGLFSFISGLLGAGAAKGASRRAETAQLGYLNTALGEEHRQFDLTRSDYAPYTAEGSAAATAEGNLVGLNGDGVQQSALDALKASPLYQMLYHNGLEANLQNASATGGIRGGNEVRSLADFGTDTFAQTIQRQLESLGGIAGRGAGAVGGASAAGGNIVSQIAQLLGQQGQVRAGGILTRGGITNGMFQNAGGFLDQIGSKIPGLGPFAAAF